MGLGADQADPRDHREIIDAMAHTTLNREGHTSLTSQLKQFGHWLFDAAALGLGFSAPQDHPSPPNVGAQPFSGGDSRLRRRSRHRV